MSTTTARIIRVFLASPGDVTEERAQARHLIKDDLPALPFIKDKAWLKIIAWDDPTSRAPMPATLSPQRAIELGMTRPSECDIVVVVFWSRMGTPLDEARHGLKDGKRPYWSGTEWEYEDALKASEATGKPVVLVYRRTANVPLNPAWHDFDERVKQLKRVEEFFAAFRDPKTGAFLRAYTEYDTPEQFGQFLKKDLLHYIEKPLAAGPPPGVPVTPAPAAAPAWPPDKSPFPGLHAFTPDDAPVFFGRGRETDALLRRVNDERFVAVVGASGSGKSSLVGAGLIPRLLDNAIPGSKDWLWRRFTPGEVSDNPFSALAVQLAPLTGQAPRELADELAADPGALCATIERALDAAPEWAELLLFVDQFEELFTLASAGHRARFVEFLAAAATTDRLRTVLTLRADFYHRCVEYPRLAELLRAGSFPLAAPELDALLDMIERPAVIAGLQFDAGLPGRILRDTGQEPGALALMAYTLDELYTLAGTHGDRCLTFADYDKLGGVEQAIGTRAEGVFSKLDQAARDTLPHVFRELVAVNVEGTPTRKRARLGRVTTDEAARRLVEALTGARLLVPSRGDDHQPVIEVAHEALFRSWPTLKTWIEQTKGDLYLLQQVQEAAAEWGRYKRNNAFLWADERLQPVYAMQARLRPNLDDLTRAFIRPEAERLIEELNVIDIPHTRRATIGERLAVLGDLRPGVGLRPDGLPNIAWCPVPGGEVTLKDDDGKSLGQFTVEPFYIARYPVTYSQFQAFQDDPEGFDNDTWWEGLRKQSIRDQSYKFPNQLRDSIDWWQTIAFCRWLTAKLPPDGWPEEALAPVPSPSERGVVGWLLGREPARTATWEIRLPTEWEWFQAATGGDPSHVYPWGPTWDARRANAREAGLGRGAAAGLYPAGASPVGALDMVGGLWEWCLNERGTPENVRSGGTDSRALRGGYYGSSADRCACAARNFDTPVDRNVDLGLRVCCAAGAVPMK